MGDASKYVLVVPACNERVDTVQRLLQTLPEGVLVVLVVNRRPDAPPEPNRCLVDAFAGRRDVRVIDRGATLHGGAGAARQVGAKAALNMLDAGEVESRWIHFTDADTVELPHDFFAAAEAAWKPRSSMAVHSTRMVVEAGDPPEAKAAAKWWNLGCLLRLVGMSRTLSPWPTMETSTISVTARSVRASGVLYPPYRVAEDSAAFVLFGSMGIIHRLPGGPVLIDGRPETKGPVGLGSTVKLYRKAISNGVAIHMPQVRVFAHIRAIYDVMRAVWEFGQEQNDAVAAVCSTPGLFKQDIDSYAIREGIVASVGSVAGRAVDLGWTPDASHRKPWEWFAQRAIDIRTVSTIGAHMTTRFGHSDMSALLTAFGWGDGSDLDASLAAGRKAEASECCRDYGLTEP